MLSSGDKNSFATRVWTLLRRDESQRCLLTVIGVWEAEVQVVFAPVQLNQSQGCLLTFAICSLQFQDKHRSQVSKCGGWVYATNLLNYRTYKHNDATGEWVVFPSNLVKMEIITVKANTSQDVQYVAVIKYVLLFFMCYLISNMT